MRQGEEMRRRRGVVTTGGGGDKKGGGNKRGSGIKRAAGTRRAAAGTTLWQRSHQAARPQRENEMGTQAAEAHPGGERDLVGERNL
jgi:hypothetical protein